MRQSIPAGVWAEYGREMARLWPRWGKAAVLRRRRLFDEGELEGVPLVQDGGRTIGLALYRTYPGTGRQGEGFFLAGGHRSLRSVRSQLQGFLAVGEAPLLSLPAPLPGIPWNVERAALTEQGFRWVERQGLVIDPREARRVPSVPPSFPLRTMEHRDQAAVVRLDLRAYRHHIDEAFGPGANVARWGPDYLRWLFTERDPAVDLSSSLVATGPRGLVGQVLVMGEASPHIQDLAVDPAYRGRGIASSLIREALGRLADRGVRRVTIGVTVKNPTGAYPLYRRLGFHRDRTPAGRLAGLWIHDVSRRRLRLALLGDGATGPQRSAP